jgi:hypothetical protein
LRSNKTIQIGQENLPGAPVSIIIAIGQWMPTNVCGDIYGFSYAMCIH